MERIDEEADTLDKDEGVLDVSELDGLFTAIVSGPVTTLPSKWLPAIWGDFEPVWKSEKEFEEIFSLMMQEIRRSGYDGLLPAGLVLTGGSAQLAGIRQLASDVMGLPARVARPENLVGMVDRLHSPAFSTSVGLVQYAMQMKEVDPSAVEMPKYVPNLRGPINWGKIKDVLKRFLP